MTVTARRTGEQDIYRNRSTSVACYDVNSEMDDLYDTGKYVGENIHELLMNMNSDLYIRQFDEYEFLYYKGRMLLFVIDYEITPWNAPGFLNISRAVPAMNMTAPSVLCNTRRSAVATVYLYLTIYSGLLRTAHNDCEFVVFHLFPVWAVRIIVLAIVLYEDYFLLYNKKAVFFRITPLTHVSSLHLRLPIRDVRLFFCQT